jgi:hypothetical protein
LLIVGMALAAVAVLGALVFVANNMPKGQSPLDVSIARAPERTPIPPPTRPPTPSPSSASLPPATYQPSSPLPTHDLPDDPALAFAARMNAGSASYRVDCRGSFVVGNTVGNFSSSTSVSGADMAGEYEFSMGRIRVAAEVVVKDGAQYVRPSGEEWTRIADVESSMPGDLLTTFGATDWGLMKVVGRERRDGQRVHHLRIPNVDWQALSETLFEDQGELIKGVKLDVWVTPSGVPVEAKLSVEGTTTEDGVELDFEIDFDYRFTRFGEPLPIEAPTDYSVDDGGSVS